jgi:hypothetical protein
LLCGDTEDTPKISAVVTTPMKLDRLQKSDIRSQNKRTVYNVHKFFKDIYEQPAHFSDINVHKTQITVKACDVHCSAVQKVCSEAFISSSDSQVFASPRKACKRKRGVTDMNSFDKDVLWWTVCEFYDKGNVLQHHS